NPLLPLYSVPDEGRKPRRPLVDRTGNTPYTRDSVTAHARTGGGPAPDRLSIGKRARLAGGGDPHERADGVTESPARGGRAVGAGAGGAGGGGAGGAHDGGGDRLPRGEGRGGGCRHSPRRGQALLLAAGRPQRRDPDARLAPGQGRARHADRPRPPEVRLVLP